jgi:Calcineurin-like phosphoesterase
MTGILDPSGRKDLQDLRDLPRTPFLSYLHKQGPPQAPRVAAVALASPRYAFLAAFSPKRLFKWMWEYFAHRIGPRHPFQTYAKSDPDQGVYRLEGGEEIRIALAGDWATGTDEAEHVGRLIAKFEPHYSIHLGDIYYVGTAKEVDENFLGVNNPHNGFAPCLWPMGSRGSFALNGNHEMYARGHAYFDRMLPALGLIVDGKAQGQKASFFCLENEHWRIIALDTGYDSIGCPLLENFVRPECALRPEEIDWLRDVVRLRNDDPRGIILLTHHQYYSRFDNWYTQQAKQLAPFLSRPVLWFWGHEHRMAIYPEYGVEGGIRAFGRCIGHGGMPVELPPKHPKYPECVVEFIDNRLYPNNEHLKIGFNGFARLSLRGNRLRVDYVDVFGRVIFSESWRTENGALQRLYDGGLKS